MLPIGEHVAVGMHLLIKSILALIHLAMIGNGITT